MHQRVGRVDQTGDAEIGRARDGQRGRRVDRAGEDGVAGAATPQRDRLEAGDGSCSSADQDGGVQSVGAEAAVQRPDQFRHGDHVIAIQRVQHATGDRIGIDVDHVGEIVGGDIECHRRAVAYVDGEVLEVGAEHERWRHRGTGHLQYHRIDAAIGRFDDHIGAAVDAVGIVAGATAHAVVASTAVEQIVAAPADQGVVAAIAEQLVVPGLAVEDVVADVAAIDHIGKQIAVDAKAVVAQHRDVLDRHEVLRGQIVERVGGKVDVQLHQIGTAVGGFDDHIGEAVDLVGVVADATFQRVGAGAAGERIVAAEAKQAIITGEAVDNVVEAAAGNDVGQFVARARARAGGKLHLEMFDIGRQREVGGAAEDDVGSLVGQLGDDVGVIADNIAVVTDPADERVGQGVGTAGRVGPQQIVAGAALDLVALVVADENVVERIALQVDWRIDIGWRAGNIGQNDIINTGKPGIKGQVDGNARVEFVDALSGELDHDVARAVHGVSVIAGAAAHAVVAGATVHRIVAGPAQQRVVAGAADEQVAAGATVEQIVAAVPGHAVVERIAGAVDGAGRRQQLEILDVGAEDVRAPTSAGAHQVDPAAEALGDAVVEVVDHVGVVAQATNERVGAGAAIEQIAALVAGEHIAQGVAGEAGAGAGEGAVLDIGDQGVVAAAGEQDQIGAGAGTSALDHDVAHGVEQIGIVAGAAGERVVAGAAVDPVVAALAFERVVGGVAGDDVVRGVAAHLGRERSLCQGDAFDFGGGDVEEARARVVDVHEHLIVAAVRLLHHQVTGLLDQIEVVAGTAGHRVAPALAVEQVVARAAEQVVGTAGTGDGIVQRVAHQRGAGRECGDQVLDEVGQREHRAVGADGVVAAVGRLDDGVGAAVDVEHDIAVIAEAADQLVGAGAAIERVVAQAAGEAVVARLAGERVVARAAVDRVVARAGGHGVVAEQRIDDISGAVAGDDVVEFVAGAIDREPARQREVLDVGAQRPGDAGGDAIGALARVLDGFVAEVVDDESVVAQAAFEGIFAGAAVELVVADVADDVIVQRVADAVEIVVGADAGQRGEEQILDVVRQGEGERDLDGVVSATGIFDDEETA